MPPLAIAIIIILSVLVFLFMVYLFLVAPRKARPEMKKYKGARFAHRGLHGDGAAENSMTAFRRAIEAGYGIELDIRLSKDGKLVVYHDATLERVSGINEKVENKTLEELKEIKLLDTEDTVAAFGDVLNLVSGKVPLLVEIKEEHGSTAVTEAAIKVLSDYEGDFIVESFNPFSLALIRKRMPDALRGILSDNFLKNKKHRSPTFFIVQYMLTNFLVRPDFVAFEKNGYKNPSFRICRALGALSFAWTTTSEDEENAALAHGFDGLIFERK